MNAYVYFILIVASANVAVLAQRGSYAGSRSIGYKDRFRPRSVEDANELNGIVGRFGASEGIDRPPQSSIPFLPYDARGDAALVYYLLSLPEERRPFWLLNYRAIEAHRNTLYNGGSVNAISPRSSFLGK